MVAVDLGDGTHAELPLVDVVGTVAMAPSLSDVRIHVSEPLDFVGRFVPRGLGGPAAFVPRTYRGQHGGIRLDGNVPFEVVLSSDPSVVRARFPSAGPTGVLTVSVPCSELRAGAPRYAFRPRPGDARPRLIALAPGTHVVSGAGHGAEIARVEREDSSREPVIFVGTVEAASEGFAPVSLRVGPMRVAGFVPESSVRDMGVGVAATSPEGGYVPQTEPVDGMRRVRLPVGTSLFASATATAPWATVHGAPLDVWLRSPAPAERSALTLGPELLEAQPCRYDGVAGRAHCGDARELPPLGVRSCTGEACRDVAYVSVPPAGPEAAAD